MEKYTVNMNLRYTTQPTDMDGATLRSCLVPNPLAHHVSSDAVPLTERNAITTWYDDSGNAVACEISDHMDEHGRYRRVRRFITVPDMHPEEYGYINGHVELMYTCATCDDGPYDKCEGRCSTCQWTEEMFGELRIYVLDKWRGAPALVS